MDLSFNEDESGKYSIAILLDQEAQMYAIETGQSSIGGLQSIIESSRWLTAPVFMKKIICLALWYVIHLIALMNLKNN